MVRCGIPFLEKFPDDFENACIAPPIDSKRILGLDLDYQNMTNLRTNSFKELSKLLTLSVIKNKITNIENGAFNGLEKFK